MDLFYLTFMVIVGVVYVLGAFLATRIVAPAHEDPVKSTPYECGEYPFGSAWTRFNVGYYIFALTFLLFEVEVVFIFPWAVVLKEVGVAALVEGLMFLAVLAFGLLFVWRKGYLVWK